MPRSEPGLFLAGGGTGGHVMPGLAIAAAFSAAYPSQRITILGSNREIERQMLAGTPYRHIPLPAVSPGNMLRSPFSTSWKNILAVRIAYKIIREERPRVVVGLGGYASLPGVLAAAICRVPIVLLEQNAVPGRANRWLSWFASHICCAYESAAIALVGKRRANAGVPTAESNSRATVTGNPLRTEFERPTVTALPETSTVSSSDASWGKLSATSPSTSRLRLLVLGGSLGAARLNAAMRDVAIQSPEPLRGLQIMHQTGDQPRGAVDRDTLQAAYQQAGIDANVVPHISDMATALRSADIVACRAGALTLSEVAACGKPAIVVPLSTSVDQHQQHNAAYFASAGAAIVVDETETNFVETLAAAIHALTAAGDRRQQMQAAMLRLAKPNATAAVLAVIQRVSRSSASVPKQNGD